MSPPYSVQDVTRLQDLHARMRDRLTEDSWQITRSQRLTAALSAVREIQVAAQARAALLALQHAGRS